MVIFLFNCCLRKLKTLTRSQESRNKMKKTVIVLGGRMGQCCLSTTGHLCTIRDFRNIHCNREEALSVLCGKYNHQGRKMSLTDEMAEVPGTFPTVPRGDHQPKIWTSFEASCCNHAATRLWLEYLAKDALCQWLNKISLLGLSKNIIPSAGESTQT